MHKTFKAPDLNAPRFRPKRYEVLTNELYNKFLKAYPKHAKVSYKLFKEIIVNINGQIWNTVLDYRDGVELPEQLGYIFIGSCQRKVKSNMDAKKSMQYGRLIQSRNWESDDYLAKIFYTNYNPKYKFKNHDLWGFQGVRQFKRTVAKVYPTDFKKYIVVDNMMVVSNLFKKYKTKDFMKKRLVEKLEKYDEFNLD